MPDGATYRLTFEDGGRAKVSSPQGSIIIKVRITDRVSPGTVFIPMHYAEAAVNMLTSDADIDSASKTPGFKITAVRIEPAREGE